jgi:hypothetical protein
MTPQSFITGVRTVSASFQRAPIVHHRDWSKIGLIGITCTGQFSGFRLRRATTCGSNMLRGIGQNEFSV